MTGAFVCTPSDIDESYGPTEEQIIEDGEAVLCKLVGSTGIRTLMISAYEITRTLIWKAFMERPAHCRGSLLNYACLVPSRQRRTPMDVDTMVKRWAALVPKLSMAHDKDELDMAEAQLDELLTPLLAAPVKQLREFFAGLVEALKADPTVPYFVWRTYEVWHEKVIKPAKVEEIKQLKRDLAEEVVGLVDPSQPDIQADIRESMIRALMWRSPERLEEVKEALVKGKTTGVRPRVKGRESCLFLQVDRGEGQEPAEIML